jgi:hypothetical protein
MRSLTRSLLFFALPALLAAQSTLTITGPVNSKPGRTVAVSLNLTSTTANPVVGIQWDTALLAGWTATVVNGPVSVTAAKDLTCTPTNLVCIVDGLNQNVIANGVVAAYTVSIPATALAGLVSIPLTNLVASDAIGLEVPLVSGPVYSVRVIAKHDLNSDGVTNLLDVQLMRRQRLGLDPCTDDQNEDAKCNVRDVVLVSRAALGL